MTTFITLVLILVCINAAMILASLYGANKTRSTSSKGISDSSISKIYPLDLFTTDYKKAVQFFTFTNKSNPVFKSFLDRHSLFSGLKVIVKYNETIVASFFRGWCRQYIATYYLQNVQQLFSTLLLGHFYCECYRMPHYRAGIRTLSQE